jgi:flagellar FliJ protein
MSPVGRFRFSLETVLKVRGLREEQAKADLARAQQELERSFQALADSETLRDRLLATLASPQQEWTPQDFTLFRNYLYYVKTGIDGLRQRIQEQEAQIQEKKEILHRRYQERRLLEQVRHKHYLRYKRELNKVMEKETEAIVLGRWPGQPRS